MITEICEPNTDETVKVARVGNIETMESAFQHAGRGFFYGELGQ